MSNTNAKNLARGCDSGLFCRMKKLSKKQRRLASKLLFPFIALCMMTTAMALGSQRASTASSNVVSSPSR